VFGAVITSLVLLIGRARRAAPAERDQVRLLAWSAVVGTILAVPTTMSNGTGVWVYVLAALGIVLIPASVGYAILRHRLFDIDLVIRRTVLFGILIAFIAVAYVGIVVALPALVLGRRAGRSFDLLPFVAAAIIALAFEPVRRWARHLAARLVYGRRATPYDVLSDMAGGMGAVSATDLAPRIARPLAEGTGAELAVVWLRVGDELRPAASWPPGREDAPAVSLPGGDLRHLPAERSGIGASCWARSPWTSHPATP
jgi:hypothetical protein